MSLRSVLLVLCVLCAPATSFRVYPVVPRKHICSSSRVGPLFALERPLQPLNKIARLAPLASEPDLSRKRMPQIVSICRAAFIAWVANSLLWSPAALAAKKPLPRVHMPAVRANNPVIMGPASFLVSTAMVCGLVFWSVQYANWEDMEEQKRIKMETERQEDLRLEQTNMDGVLSSLRSRLGNTTAANSYNKKL